MKVLTTFLLVFFILSADLSIYSQSSTDDLFHGLEFRNIGPFRGGRSVASSGVIGDPLTYYMGSTGGGVWKTTDAGVSWKNISDGQLKTGSVGAIAVSSSDPNVVYVGMGEHPVRGVMTSHGDGVYKSTDAGKTWNHLGLPESRHIAEIVIHPTNPEILYVAVQGAVHGDSDERGIYKSADGGVTWDKKFYINPSTGAADISMDATNPRILYASMWDHRRTPWQVRSGGPGSSIHKSIDAGETWIKLTKGLPAEMGKVSADVSPANPNVVYANIEAEGTKGGVYRSNDGGQSWTQTTSDRVTVARAWYYIETFADPKDPNTLYVLNAPMLRSIDGGKTFKSVRNPHGDQHHMWINPNNPENIILSNDGGACITFNGGSTWSSQENQPTIQFYRVITDNKFPYNVYGGQQDNSSLITASRTNKSGIGWKDWNSGPGCESAFLAFDPDNPNEIFGTCIQGGITALDITTCIERDVMAHPIIGLGWTPKDMRYRFNWNAPVVADLVDPSIMYHGANKVLKTSDRGFSWQEISPDLTRDDESKQGAGGIPYTNEGAGGEVYNTISYIELSENDQNTIWVGSDCGLVHVTTDGGVNWSNVTPKNLGEVLINAIEVSPHNPSVAYVVATNYKFNDFRPMIYRTDNMGKSWRLISTGLPVDSWARVVREDPVRPGLLYAGTETSMFISSDSGASWEPFQRNLPICPITDMTFRDNDLVVSTSGRSFWILDDLSSLQQYQDTKELDIYKPKPTVRFGGGGGFRPGASKGANPANGVILDYYLPTELDSQELILHIYDLDSNLVRSYSSKKDPEYKKFTGGPSAEKRLPVKSGVNRFVWDMQRESIQPVHGVFKLGGYSGALVPPSTYIVQLSAGDQSTWTELEIIPDPRMHVDMSAYEEQYNLAMQLESAVQEIHRSVIETNSIKKTLKDYISKETDSDDELFQLAQSLKINIQSWEENLVQYDQKTFQDVINFPNKLNAEITNLMSTIGGLDPTLTHGMRERAKELLDSWQNYKDQRLGSLQQQIDDFNQKYTEAQIPFIK